jgi:hypothetical protein
MRIYHLNNFLVVGAVLGAAPPPPQAPAPVNGPAIEGTAVATSQFRNLVNKAAADTLNSLAPAKRCRQVNTCTRQNLVVRKPWWVDPPTHV